MIPSKVVARDVLVLLVVCYFAFWWRLGHLGLIDPDEPFYAQTVREMVQTGDWLTPKIFGQPQFEKPILFYWLAAGSFKILGESEFAARFPSAFFATLSVLMTYVFARRVFTARVGLLAAFVMATGLEFCVMARLMLTDIALAAFVAASLYSFWMAACEQSRRNFWMFAHLFFSALAVLTKGPIGSLIPLMATMSFVFITKRRLPYRGAGFWWGLLVYALIAVPWYAIMLAKFGWKFFDEFFVRDNWLRLIRAEHPANNHFYYYIGLLLLGSIPWMPMVAVTAWRAFAGIRRDERQLFLWCWLLSNLVFFTIAQSKLPSYIFFLFVPLGLLVGTTLDSILEHGFRSRAERWVVIALAATQVSVGLCAPLIKVARPFEMPALFFAGFLGIGLLLLLARQVMAWVVATSLATIALLIGALTFSANNVELMTSTRPVARELLRLREGGEPLLGSNFLVRGVYYYTRDLMDDPVEVIAGKAQPFWAEHPLTVVVWKGNSLPDFLREHKTALCAVRQSDWRLLKTHQEFRGGDPLWDSGENVIVRARESANNSGSSN